MVIEHNGARLVIKPACVEDLGREGEEGDKRRLFVAFDFGDNEVLRRAYESEYRAEFTDDASVVEAVGQAVCLAEGERENLKLTTPGDFVIAEALIAAREEAENEEGTTDAEHV